MSIPVFTDETRPRPEGERVTISFPEPTMTAQSFKDECDINTIVNQWQRTGDFAHLNKRQPSYGDFTNATDYQSALNTIDLASAGFAALSSAVRDRFHNNPTELMSFLDDPANQDEAGTLGLSEIKPPADLPVDPPATPGGEPAPPPGVFRPHFRGRLVTPLDAN